MKRNKLYLPIVWSFATSLPLTLLLPACDGQAGPDYATGRITINSDRHDLSAAVAANYAPLRVVPQGLINGLALAPDPEYALTVVAEVAPPQIDGVDLQATSIVFAGKRVVVSYNTAGDVQQGAIDVFTIDSNRNLALTSRATFDDTDVNAVASAGGRVWLATATSDETFGTPAVLEGMSITDSGALTLDDHVRVALSSFAATGVTVGDSRVFATSGDGGGVFAYDPARGRVVASTKLADARWVAESDSGLVVVRGTPGSVEVMAEDDLSSLASYPFDGAQIRESKSTVQVAGGKAIIAGGPGGAIVMDLASGETLAQIRPPSGLALPGSEVVTNAVSVDGKLMFVSNGAAGVYLVASSESFSVPRDPKVASPVLRTVGRLAFAGDLASVNHIAYRDGLLFVASGRGGLKVVRVEDLTAPATVNAYPYTTDFGNQAARTGWKLEGDWGWGAADDERHGVSGAFLDNDPSLFDQQNVVSAATLELPLTIPEGGSPSLSFYYGADFVSPADAVEVQVRRDDSADWIVLATIGIGNEHTDVVRRVVPLDDFRGDTVNVRFLQHMGAASGVRRFTVDDLAVGPLTLPTLGYPFETGFDSTAERAQWSLDGWSWSTGDEGGAEVEGTRLVCRPSDVASNSGSKQVELLGFIPVPTRDEVGATGAEPVVSLWYRSDLAPGDVVALEIQSADDDGWHELTTFAPASYSNGVWAYREIALGAYAGQDVRVRLGLAFADQVGTRAFVVDNLRVGPLAASVVAYPYSNDFDSAVATRGWIATGDLAVATYDGGSGIVSDPARSEAEGEGEIHMSDYLALPAVGPIQLTFRAALALATGDELVVEAQRGNSTTWQSVAFFGTRQSHPDQTRYEVPLDALAGESVRLRFRASFSGAGHHAVVIDDIAVGGLSDERLDYPFVAALDRTGLASWTVAGAWTAVDGVVDANPSEASHAGWGEGQELTMPGYVLVPATGRPTLFVSLDLALADDDVVFVEAQTSDDATWTALATYTAAANRPSFGWDELSLDRFADRAVRMRVRYQFGAAGSVRRVRVGDVRIEDLAPQHFASPWANGLDTVDAVAQWTLWGGWGADGFLDGNREGVAVQHEGKQTATTVGDIAVPSDRSSWLGFRHHFGAAVTDDALDVQVQPDDSVAWTTIATLGQQHLRTGMSALELPLDAWAGRSLRVRFALRYGASDVVRDVAVDDVWVGPLSLPRFAPIALDFASPDSNDNWRLSGNWQVSDDALRFNAYGIDTAGYSTFQTATFGGFVDISGIVVPSVTMGYQLHLVSADDRAYVEVLALGTTRWVAVATLTRDDNGSDLSGRWPIQGHDPVAVRVRVVASDSPGVRAVTVRTLSVGL